MDLLPLQAANLCRQLLQAVAAVVAQGPLQAADFNALGLTLRIQALDLCIEPGRIVRQQVEAAVQQLALEPGEIRSKLIARIPPAPNLGREQLVARAVVDQGRQQVHLPLGLEHGLVRPVQVVEVADQGLDAAPHVEGFQHVAAHEVSEVAHRLHRDRLVEQLQGLLVLDAEAPAEPGPIRREAVEQFAARAPQLLAQGSDVTAEAAEVISDGQCPLSRHKQACGLALRVLQPEDLGQRHGLVIALVAEDAQDDRVARRIAQRHGPGAARHLIALALVVAQHVGPQGALAGICPGRLVVGHAMRRHEQGRDGIDQRGLARTDVAREQAIAPVELMAPHALVEGAPVEHFQPLQTKADAAVVGHEVQPQCPSVHRCLTHPPSPGRHPDPRRPTAPCGRPPAARRTPPATVRRRMPSGCAVPRSGLCPAHRQQQA